MTTMTAPLDLDDLVDFTAEPAPAPRERIARRVTMAEAKRHFDAGGDVLVSEYGHEPVRPVSPLSTVHNKDTRGWAQLRHEVDEWRNRYPNQRYYIVVDVPAGPAPEPERVDEYDDDSPHITVAGLRRDPSVAQAIWAGIHAVMPGARKETAEKRKALFAAIGAELNDITVYGIDVTDARLPIGEPVILGNASIELDAFGDAVRIIVTDGGVPIWNHP